jgi:MipA family protein
VTITPLKAAPRFARLCGPVTRQQSPQHAHRPPTLAVALALLMLFAGIAHSLTPSTFDDADTDHDGRITLQEFEAYVARRLQDLNGPAAQRFKQLSPPEQEARIQGRFEKADRGHKGYLDRTDWDAVDIPRGEQPGVPREGLSLGTVLSEVDPGYVGFHRQATLVPLITYRSGPFFFSGAEAGVIAAQGSAYTLSFDLVPELNRVSASDSPELAGIKTREWTVDGSMNLTMQQPWGGKVSFAVLHDILDRNNGTELRANYAYPVRLGAGWLIPGIGVTWQSATLTNYYYGVSPAESLPNRPAYSPGSALNPNARLGYFVPVSNKWLVGAQVGYTKFATAITDSPIVDRSGSVSGLIMFMYSFSAGANAAAAPTMPVQH